mgnify:FL=1
MNQVVEEKNSIFEVISYKESFGGVIKSFEDRIPFNEHLYSEIIDEWNKYKSFLMVAKPVEEESLLALGKNKI